MKSNTNVHLSGKHQSQVYRNAISQEQVDQAEADYCEALCRYGRDSAEALVAYRQWMELNTLHSHKVPALDL